MKIFFLPLLITAMFSCKAQPPLAKLAINADNNSLLWEISGKGLTAPSYLFGTFHLMCKEDIRFSSNLQQALKNSAEVFFEMDLDDPANTLGALFVMNMKGGKTLKDLYNPADYKRVNGFFADSLQLPMAMLQRFKPSMLEVMLYPKMMACKNMSGVEEALMAMAKADKKEISGFETLAFQASVFDSIPYELQAKSLLKTIDSLDQYKVEFDKMLNAYKAQQLATIESLFNESDFDMEGNNKDILLDNRNKNWVGQLKTILPKKNIFMAVGAGHLVGSNGLIELLRKDGYTVKPIVN